MRNPENWPEEVYIVDSVEVDRGYNYIRSGSSGFGVPNKYLDEDIKPGDEVVRYGGWGGSTKGVVVNGTIAFYQTRAEAEMIHEEWRAWYSRKKTCEAEANIEDYRTRVAKLSDPYRKRIERFIAERGEMEFWIDDHGYELFTLEQSDLMRRWALEKDPENPVQALKDWNDINSEKHGYDYKRQAAEMPGYSEDHSGNTHGAAVGLAIAVLEGREI